MKNYGMKKEQMMVYKMWLNDCMGQKKQINDTGDIIFSVILNPKRCDEAVLRKQIVSIINQDYDGWELFVLSDINQFSKNVLEEIASYGMHDKVHFGAGIGPVLKKCREYTLFLDCAGVLEQCALKVLSKEISSHNNTNLIYFDEDLYNESQGIYDSVCLKPGWSPYLLLNVPYVKNAVLIRTSLASNVFSNGKENPESIYDLSLRIVEQVDFYGVYHISLPLLHLLGDEKEFDCFDVKKNYLLRNNIAGKIEKTDYNSLSNVVFSPIDNPLVSIIIPSKDHPDVLYRCIKSLINKTSYKNYELIVVDNGSNEENKKIIEEFLLEMSVKYFYSVMPFNYSRMCGIGVDAAKGDFLCFLNDDIEVVQADWIDRLLGQAQQKRVGAVGAKLYYPNTTLIQHAGMANSECGVRHSFMKQDDSRLHCLGLNKVSYDCLSVTAACMLISRKTYESVSGFDWNLAVAYNDVDLCVKLVERGLFNIVRNDVVLYHHESLSRGNDLADETTAARLYKEQDFFYSKHKMLLGGVDPFLNANVKAYDSEPSFKFCDMYSNSTIQMLDFARSHNVLYIYGAGNYAKLCYSILLKMDLPVSGFVVSESEGNPSFFMNRPVCLFSDYIQKDMHQRGGLILALKTEFVNEIIPKLEKEAFTDYFIFMK